MNILYIDTRDNKQIVVRFEKGEEAFELKSEAVRDHAQTILPLIDKLLNEANIKISDLHEIRVETGPGSFTGIRVGVAIANALSFGAEIKINGKPYSEIALPEY